MKLKWLLFIVPISTFVATVPALSQSLNVLPIGELNQYPEIQKDEADTTIGIADAYSFNESAVTGWYQRPGQMPVFIPDSTLTESMPILFAPDVDSKMIIPMGDKADVGFKDPKDPS